MNRRSAIARLMSLTAPAVMSIGCSARRSTDRAVILLGIDGMDPNLLHQYIQKDHMPNFQSLMRYGSFRELRTSIPPQSPVAWSNVITGMNPGGHGLFDFIHRDPRTMMPYFSMARVQAPAHTLTLADWVIPLSRGKAINLRHGAAFWEILDAHGVPATVLHMPANFPPVECRSRTLAGMGTPDMVGSYGTFSFYTSDPAEEEGDVSGGHIYTVQVQNNRVSATLFGPPDTFQKGVPPVPINFTAWLDPYKPVARVNLQDHELILQEGEWSDWVQLRFPLFPVLENASGICKIYLKQLSPNFKLYISPINIDPSQPALPLSTPSSYVRDLSKRAGLFYTQGIAEDTKALSAGVFTDREFLEQSQMVMNEQLKLFDRELARFHSGLFFAYFSSLDQNAHMFWRTFDKNSPSYGPELAAKYGGTLESFYEQMDHMLGKALAKHDNRTTLIVCSDHGFAPFNRSFNLNTWLLENEYVALKPNRGEKPWNLFDDVDWRNTRAYGLGLQALYLNLMGRERYGVVPSGALAEALKTEIRDKLLAVRDSETGLAPISRVDEAEHVYTGPCAREAPDLIVGYNRRYRAGWGTILGDFSDNVLETNEEPWSGDHCIDHTLVPGVLLSNKAIVDKAPALTDIAPTILAEFGIAKPKDMVGQSVLQS